jgi:hypothetical protein
MRSFHIMSVVGSAVPEHLRDLGLLACWYVVFDGNVVSPPLMSRKAAEQHCRDMGRCLAA